MKMLDLRYSSMQNIWAQQILFLGIEVKGFLVFVV